MRVVRVPISGAIETVANLLTLGKFKKSKEDLNIDNYFHLFIETAFYKLDENGQRIVNMALIEKNQKVDVRLNREGGLGAGQEAINVPLIRNDLTLNEFFYNAEQAVGGSRLYVYEATSNNCQRFVADLLQSNGLWTEDMAPFVLQDVATAVPKYLKTLMGWSTGLANKMRTFFRGKGV